MRWNDETNAHTSSAPPVRWEPCPAFHDGFAAGVCVGCGWPPDDHEAPIAPVVALPSIPQALPRAS